MKNLLWAVVGIAVLAGAYLLINNLQKPTNQPPSKTNQSNFSVTKKEVPKEQAPTGFPSGVPLEVGAVIVQNYEADISDGRHQATRSFESKKTVAQNYQIYLEFFTKNGWEITNKYQTENLASIFAKKAETELSATIAKNTVSGVVTVEVTAIAKKS